MAFDLYVTFAGLCLFRSKNGEPLRVLIPRNVPGHQTVVGHHVRYVGEIGTPGHRFRECPVPRGGRIRLPLVAGDPLMTGLDGYDVADITRVAGRPADVGKSHAEIVIPSGRACPTDVCEHPAGGLWEVAWPRRTSAIPMAISLTWRICGVEGELPNGGGEGLVLSVETECSTGTVAELRPDANRQIRYYVFHTPPDEFPSCSPPPFEMLPPGHEARHFRHYFDLFPGSQPPPNPKFKGVQVGPRFLGVAHFGRRFTCMLAAADEA